MDHNTTIVPVLDDIENLENQKKKPTLSKTYGYILGSVLAISIVLGCDLEKESPRSELPERIENLDKSLEERKQEIRDLKPIDISKITTDDIVRLSTEEQIKKR